MKKKIERMLADSLAVLSYAVPIGLGVWQVLRRKNGTALTAYHSKPLVESGTEGHSASVSAKQQGEKVESLSFSTPGDAPLDRLAREAAWEREFENQRSYSDLKTPVPPGSDNPRPSKDESVEGLLDHQSLLDFRLEGWSLPEPERLPIPTYAPAIMAFGIVTFAMGLATVWYVCLVGSLVFAVAAWRWVGELQGE